MRFNKLDLNLLVALDAMLTERSISRAAERLHISQSATSNALARLREYFDDELLVQVGRKMELTPRAEALRDPVRDVLVRVDSTIVTQPEFVPSRSDRLFRILVSDFTLVTLMPHALALADRQGSTVRFEFLPQVENPPRMLERGEADLLVMPRDYCSPNHPAETVFTEHFTCVVWRGSRLAREGLTFESYADAGHVVMQPGGAGRASLADWFLERHDLARRVAVKAFSFAAAPYLVVGTELVATMHTRLARIAQNALPIMLLPPPVEMPVLVQAMQWHKYRSLDPGIVWLRQLLMDAAEEMDRVMVA
jgi:LysR family nod box-dependent transcriptional activator